MTNAPCFSIRSKKEITYSKEILNPKHEMRNAKQIQNTNDQMFKNQEENWIYHIATYLYFKKFWLFDFKILVIVSSFDIRISNFPISIILIANSVFNWEISYLPVYKEIKMEIKTFGVVGAGQMGNGIAQVAAMSGLNVIMSDIKNEFLVRGLGIINKMLQRSVDKAKMNSEEMDEVLGRITTTVDLKDMADADFVVEAAIEHEPIKFQIFEELDKTCASHVILATNTSSIPIGRIAARTKRPDKVVGMHFMNPAPVMKLVEIIRGLATSDKTFKTTWDLAEKFGKTPAKANDYPGFIANRILMPMINEAIYCLYHGVGTREDIDTVMKLGMNHPMGPLALADLIGLDTCLAIMDTLSDGFKDSKYRPCPLLRKYVETGWLGKKTGRGFYEYE
jgi:3-hydroxybutyryl-CoA dehydrogenase